MTAPHAAQTTPYAEQTLQTFIAIIGMAGRFPGAPDADAFWEGLAAGTEFITRSPEEEGTGRAFAYGVVPDADLFDAAFFGFSPREALMLDPQQRIFLECAWEALENAGCDPGAYPGVIGVYGGCGDTDHLALLREHRDLFPGVTDWQFRLACGVDFLTSRVAYKLDLNGPAVTVQTACSTSLVAVHQATQALLAGECDVALAGGATIRVPHPMEGQGDDDVLAADGRCRPFDAGASGTVSGDGAGIVVLKRLEDALADGDAVHAVIRGSAVNNDGAGKVGFTAPSVDGQAAAVRAAHLLAEVSPATIGYVEAHGTATPVGDPIEVRALSKAFGLGTGEKGFCLLGSVKSNIGHTDAAAGVIGLIKVVLSLRHELVPGTVHFRRANPEIDLDAGPFVVRAEATPWPKTATPRRAGVNSLGIGGTNAHVVVEEWRDPAPPNFPDSPAPSGGPQLLVLSARTGGALAQAATRLGEHLKRADAPLADVAWTLQSGRRGFTHRAFAVCADGEDAVSVLTGAQPHRLVTGRTTARASGVAFLFPGQGGQHLGMARDLYEREPVFREAVDTCADLAAPQLGLDLRQVLYPGAGTESWAQTRLATMTVCQPALFAIQHGLALLWRARGVTPQVVLGHSLGAYAAATTAGVLSPADALTLVLARGRILDALPSGAMLAVPLGEAALLPSLEDGLSIAAINGPAQCVVTGPAAAVDRLRERLAAEGVDARLLRISAAAHSPLVEPALAGYAELVGGITLRPPAIRWISDRTGAPVSAREACDPASWAAHLRHTVRFSDALGTLLTGGEHALLELGPGRTLSGLARRHPDYRADRPVAQSLPHAADAGGGAAEFLHATGLLWQAGVPVEWSALHHGRRPRRTALPAYPFQRRRFRLDGPDPAREAASAEEPAGSDRPELDADYVQAETRTEKIIAAAFREALGLASLGVHDNFFDLGGDSLIATRLVAGIRAELDVELGVRAFFRAPTVAALASLVDESLTGEPGEPGDPGEPGEPGEPGDPGGSPLGGPPGAPLEPEPPRESRRPLRDSSGDLSRDSLPDSLPGSPPDEQERP
ncbi:type I polyketide synthase [Streptosporangium sp. NPDC002524]|uniref:type I polyketide synthase n=1 Tax=Streptosporangium sp. NPDC002524 TaxID=3154537 RepID=UPI00332E65BA